MPSKAEVFMQESVLGFGFLGGLFTYIGVDPEEELIKALLRIAIPNTDFLLSLVLVLIGIAVTIMGIFGTYAAAGKLGLIVVGAAWMAGFIIAIGDNFTVLGAFMLIGVWIAGPFVYDYHNSS